MDVKMNNWISVEERLPTNWNPVLIYTVPEKSWEKYYTNSIFIAKYCHCSGWTELVSNPFMGNLYNSSSKKDCECVHRDYFDHLHIRLVTHWMELPEFPTIE